MIRSQLPSLLFLVLAVLFIPTMAQASGNFSVDPIAAMGGKAAPETKEFTIRLDNLSLDEIDAELERRGLGPDARKEVLDAVRADRDKDANGDAVEFKPSYSTGLVYTNCQTGQNANAFWEAGGTTSSRWFEYYNSVYTSWTSGATCQQASCKWLTYKGGQANVRWWGFEARTTAPYSPIVTNIICTWSA